MADPMSGPSTRCPWCSAELPDAGVPQCPSCGAMLISAPDVPGDIKGVTTLDTEAILRARSEPSRARGNRLLSFITGEAPPEADVAIDPQSLARPDLAVRREMLRLQIEAERADLQAESIALKADELARRGIDLSTLGAPPPAAAVEETAGSETTPLGEGAEERVGAEEPAASPVHEAAPEGDAADAGEWPREVDPGAVPGTPSQG